MVQNNLRPFSGWWQEIIKLLVATGGLLLLLLGAELLLLKHIDQLKIHPPNSRLDNNLVVESCKVDEFSNDFSLRSAHDYFPRNGGIL